jgi:succinate-semialdehyde dehydrogenase/glutarate-semialdehyde dehydrogenase
MYSDLALLIGGEWRAKGDAGCSEPVINPADGRVLANLPHAGARDLSDSVVAATDGMRVWQKISAYERANIMHRAADLFRTRLDSIARIIVQEQGKVLNEAMIEAAMAADVIDWYAEEGRRAYGRIVPGRVAGVRQMVVHEPVGIVAAFTPWNFPVVTPARKIAGALGAGCSIIIKASEETPGACVEMARCFMEAGLPAGVLNLVFGVPAEVSENLLARPEIRKISFTGSVGVGKHLAKMATRTMKRSTMELGGHSPVVVFDDVNPEQVADMIAAYKFRNAGQVCISPTRFYVQEGVYARFLERFSAYATGLRLGNGLEASTTMGPLANPRRLDAMDMFVKDALEQGGKIRAGGKRHGNEGFYYEPTIVTDVPDHSLIMTEEPFGPIAPIVTFKTFDEVVERANSLEFGLAAYAFTTSIARATAIGDALQTGMVGINSVAISTPETPFGGIKHSGHGSEGGIEGLEAYLNVKFISQAL